MKDEKIKRDDKCGILNLYPSDDIKEIPHDKCSKILNTFLSVLK